MSDENGDQGNDDTGSGDDAPPAKTFTQADRMDADTDTIKPRVRMGAFTNRRGGSGRGWQRRGEC